MSKTDLQTYNEQGFLFPVQVFDAETAAGHVAALDQIEAEHGPMHYRVKPYLLMTSAAQIATSPALLDAVEAIIGPDILLWDSAYIIKEPHNESFISWHQDLTYWGLDSDQLVTAWVALSEVTVENGCMKMLPGSHLDGQIPHRDTYDENNLLHRGQELDLTVDESSAVDVVLAPGQASLHHGWVAHASSGNCTDGRRIALSFQFVSPAVKQLHTDSESATLVRGEDRYGHFKSERLASADFEPAQVAYQGHIEALKREVYDTA